MKIELCLGIYWSILRQFETTTPGEYNRNRTYIWEIPHFYQELYNQNNMLANFMRALAKIYIQHNKLKMQMGFYSTNKLISTLITFPIQSQPTCRIQNFNHRAHEYFVLFT